MPSVSILCVDDNKNMVEALEIILGNAGYHVYTATSGVDALEILKNEQVEIAIIDYIMPQMNGIELLKRIKENYPAVEVFILTGNGTVDNAVDAMKLGACDYIMKPFKKEDVFNRINKVIKEKNLDSNNIKQSRDTSVPEFDNLIGSTPAMNKLFEMIPNIADSDSTVLVLGETGTGKEEIAKAIHNCSSSRTKMFNIIDCASINPNLIESELFGHVKGAFTGAIQEKQGLLRATEEGTLFLDEIAEIPIFIQVKLLRAIEERVIRPVGSVNSTKFNSRIIAATSRNLLEAIEKREFREDLYFRLNVVTINIPPLRERIDDIPALTDHFIQKHDKKRNLITGITEEVIEKLSSYNWPGNVRELENCIERAFTIGVKGNIGLKDIPETITAYNSNEVIPSDSSAHSLSDHEKELIIKTLSDVKGNKREAAKTLNIGVTTLYRKMEKYGIEK